MSKIDREIPYLDKTYDEPDCGCPIEEWIFRGVTMILHEEDGSVTAWADTGDWDCEIPVTATTLDEAKGQAVEWVRALPVLDA